MKGRDSVLLSPLMYVNEVCEAAYIPWGEVRWGGVCVCVGGGGGVTSYIWQSTDVHAEWPPFSALPVI